MAIRTKTEFTSHFSDKEIPIDQLLRDPAARGVETQIRGANLDGNEVIAGTGEVNALWKVVDSLDQNGNAGSVSEQGRAADLIDLTVRIARPTRGGIWKEVAKEGVKAIDTKTKAHLDAIERTGIGTYYGVNGPFKRMSQQERLAWIETNKKPGTNPSTNIREGSCIGWVLDTVGAAYEAVGKGSRWQQIKQFVVDRQSTGYALFTQLQADGWTAVHVTPDPNNLSGDPLFVHNLMKSNGTVFYGQSWGGIKLSKERNVEGFDGSTQLEQHEALARLAKVPFWAGMKNGGFHCFVGKGTTVSEFHYSEMPNSTRAIEERDIRNFASVGSTIIVMVPPSTWA